MLNAECLVSSRRNLRRSLRSSESVEQLNGQVAMLTYRRPRAVGMILAHYASDKITRDLLPRVLEGFVLLRRFVVTDVCDCGVG